MKMLITQDELDRIKTTLLKDDGHVKDEILNQIADMRRLPFIQEMATRSILSDMRGLVSNDYDLVQTRMADLVTAVYIGYAVGHAQADAQRLEDLFKTGENDEK